MSSTSVGVLTTIAIVALICAAAFILSGCAEIDFIAQCAKRNVGCLG